MNRFMVFIKTGYFFSFFLSLKSKCEIPFTQQGNTELEGLSWLSFSGIESVWLRWRCRTNHNCFDSPFQPVLKLGEFSFLCANPPHNRYRKHVDGLLRKEGHRCRSCHSQSQKLFHWQPGEGLELLSWLSGGHKLLHRTGWAVIYYLISLMKKYEQYSKNA